MGKIRLDIKGDGFITTCWVNSYKEMTERIREEMERTDFHMTVEVNYEGLR